MTLFWRLLSFFLMLLAAWPAWAGQDIMDSLFTSQEWQAKGNLEAAKRSVQEALSLEPDNHFARIRLAQIEATAGDLKTAQAGLGQVLQADPDNLLALTWMGHILLAQGLTEQAEASYQRAVKLDPANGWALLGTAACRLALGQDQEAAGFLAKAQSAAGEDADLHLALGESFSRLDLLTNARLELERSLELNPRGNRALDSAGEVYERLGLESLALDAWRQSLALTPEDARARFALLVILGRQASKALVGGDKVEAVRIWRTMLSYDPQNLEAMGSLRRLR